MTDVELIVDKITNSPHDDDLRVILADMLEERGKPTFAMMLRSPDRMGYNRLAMHNVREEVIVNFNQPKGKRWCGVGLHLFADRGKYYCASVTVGRKFKNRREAFAILRLLAAEGAVPDTIFVRRAIEGRRVTKKDLEENLMGHHA